MAIPERVKTKMKEEGLTGVNKPKRTPKHPTKSHCVMASEGGKYKFIRFGQQGVKGAGKNPKTAAEKARRKSFKARHAKNIAKGKCSAAYWADRVKWTIVLTGSMILMNFNNSLENQYAKLELEDRNNLPKLQQSSFS